MKPLLLMVTVTLFWLVNPQFWRLNHCYSWNILTIYYLPIRFLHHFPGYTFCCLNPPVFECFWPFKPTIQAQTTPGLASLPRHRSPGRFRRLATPGTGALHGRSPKGGFTWRRGGGAVQLGSTARGETFSEWEIHYLDLLGESLFPTCQVRVVRFYHSCSPPPPPPHPPPPSPPPPSPPASPPLPCPLPPCQLFANFRMQWALLDLNCRRAIGVGTAGPQPGTFRAQWAPLDLSLGPSELSEHHRTSTAR